jgi:hypothetical protein
MLVQSQWPTDHYVSDYCTPRLCIPAPLKPWELKIHVSEQSEVYGLHNGYICI